MIISTLLRKYLALLSLCWLATCLPAQAQRQQLLFNNDWKFHLGDAPGSERPTADDKAWRAVTLPHDWSIEGPFSEQWASATAYLPGGLGWYRKSFALPAGYRGKKVFVYFDGVYKNSEVWLNGHFLGKRPSGFASFQYELTPYLATTGPNVLAVKVDHREVADSRWYTGSGIYRNVYLLATAPVHIRQWGVGFTTPQVSKSAATGKVSVALTNAGATAAAVTVTSTLLNARGQAVATAKQVVNVKAKADGTASLTLPIRNPALWSADQPTLYRLRVSLAVQGKPTDEVTEEVGVRTIRFDANQGFFLNEQPTKLRGVCLHDDAGALGVAVPPEVWERRLKTLKAAGCNAIRMSHNPHADYFYRLCDRLGFLVMDEAFDEWERGKNKWVAGWNVGTPSQHGSHEYFKEWGDRDLRDMVLRNRNRPSIIMWSIGNEIDYPNDPYTHEVLNTGRNPQIYGKGYLPDHPPASEMGPLARRLVAVAKQADSTRPITAALAGVVMSNFTDYPAALDLVGYNYQEFRYPEDHKQYPQRIIYGSENGMAPSAWAAVDSNAYVSAQYLWTGIDYLGEAGKWPQRANGAGLLDMAGFPKPEFYFRQSLWTSAPMLYLTTAEAPGKPGTRQPPLAPTWNWPAASQVHVVALTNNEATELFLNGQSLGKKTGRLPAWDVPYATGELRAKGYRNNQAVSETLLRTTGAPSTLQLKPDRTTLAAKTQGLAQIEVQVVDQAGNLVTDATNEVTVTLTGPARLLGIESGDLASHEPVAAPRHKAYQGRLLLYVQATGPGPIRVALAAPGLASQTAELRAE
ncbi:sugar-binding domain-containing protein [Hymenobacter cheonanensis]|uniref:sugar-binding domain-containing protein n=1 Tax=Hymenobacter sp. CA2-7 TaxID=3063993 RepID=UPI0027123846|nr:sugar-binding domain-containing protein [Hymenobacter sp. CA2-7]MDO7885811.1 glycoside hydrolase family 2 TIM barrel-domain containing protein [Hymenobacter sp. CA2-7]